MKKKRNKQQKLAGLLAAAMVFTGAAPAVPGNAAGQKNTGAQENSIQYGDPVHITFDPGIGPGLDQSTWNAVPGFPSGEADVEGKAGYPLISDQTGPFYQLVQAGITEDRHGGLRPAMPDFTPVSLWEGYHFGGWYNKEGGKETSLPYAFPYEDTVYTARWKTDAGVTFPFTVQYYRDFNTDRTAITDPFDPAAWPGAGYDDPKQIRKFYENSWLQEGVAAGTPIGAGYSSIPGYKVKDVLIKNDEEKNYEGNPMAGSGKITVNPNTLIVKGSMPNNDLTVAYRYEPNPEKLFKITVKCIAEDTDNSQSEICPRSFLFYPVEAEYTVKPPDAAATKGYHFVSGALTNPGVSNLAEKGVISAEDAAAAGKDGSIQYDPSDGTFTGPMPNQPIEFTYTYQKDPGLRAPITVHRQDNHGVPIQNDIVIQADENQEAQIPIDAVGGYQYTPVYDGSLPTQPYPHSSLGISLTGYTQTDASHGLLRVKADSEAGGTLTVTYAEDTSDPNYWAKLTFTGPGGSFPGASENRLFVKIKDPQGKPIPVPLSDVTELVRPTPDDPQYYEFGGWYQADEGGHKGAALTETANITADQALYGDFKEKEGRWCRLTFQDDPKGYGTVAGSNTLRVKKGTPWEEVTKPPISIKPGYQLDGWYTEAGSQMVDGQTIEVDQTYTLKCVPNGIDPQQLSPQMPDAGASIGTDGTGRIEIKNTNPAAGYAVVDTTGATVGAMRGIELQKAGAAFTGLAPGTEYYVYETVPDSGLEPGDALTALSEGERSLPARVITPALKTGADPNYHATSDPADPSVMELTIHPAAPGASYALLDLDGALIQTDDSDAAGWVMESGGTAVLKSSSLKPGQTCTVTAKRGEDPQTPQEKVSMGTQCTIGTAADQKTPYTIETVGGAHIDEINGNRPDEELTKAIVQKGDQIRLKAPETGERTFLRWNFLAGNAKEAGMDEAAVAYNAPEITMPAGNLVLQAVYKNAGAATESNAQIKARQSGGAALDLSEDKKNQLLDTLLTGNAEDSISIDSGVNVTYTVSVKEGPMKATASDAARQLVADENDVQTTAVKIPWTLGSTLTRAVGGINMALPQTVEEKLEGGEIPLHLYTELPGGQLGNLNYRLYKYDPQSADLFDPEDPGAQIPMTPDPNDPNSGFTGVLSFDAEAGASYLLSYLKAWNVTIKDEKKPEESRNNVRLKVVTGTPLNEAEGYDVLTEQYQDKTTGQLWDCMGLSKGQNPDTPAYDTGLPVKGDLTLTMRYKPNEAWLSAKKKLIGTLNEAHALFVNPNTAEDDKEALGEVMAPAWTAVNHPEPGNLPTAQTFLQLDNSLNAVIADITAGGGSGGGGSGGGGSGGGGSGGGGSGGGGSGGGGSGGGGSGGGGSGTGGTGTGGSGSTGWLGKESQLPQGPAYSGIGPGYDFNGYKTYRSGVDGSWSTVGGDNSKWVFILADAAGTRVMNSWINVTYGDLRGVCTYHFDAQGIMNAGWYIGETGKSYFLNPVQGPDYGRLILGWYQDPPTKNWYYFDQFSGSMLTGWQKLGEHWYYLSPDGADGHPAGTLYTNTKTPDGYQVDADGRWMEGGK